MLATKPAPGTVPPRRQMPVIWQHLDPILIVATLLIGIFGCVMVYTVTRDPLQAAGLSPQYYLKKQAIFMVAGVVVMAAVAAIDYRRYRDWALAIYGLTIWLSTLGTDGWQSRAVCEALADRFAAAFVELDTLGALSALGV